MGRPSALRPVCRLYLLISPQSLVCWLAFLCPSLCPFMQDIISHCWTLSACPQTEPNRATGPCPALCALCVCVTFGSTPLPHTGSKRMKPQNGHVLVHAVRTVRHAPLSVRSTVANVAWRRHRLTLLIVVLSSFDDGSTLLLL